jgi:hypothetical protein
VGQLSASGKVFFGVGVALGITAAIHCSRGNYWVGLLMAVVAALEFVLAYTTSKQVRG